MAALLVWCHIVVSSLPNSSAIIMWLATACRSNLSIRVLPFSRQCISPFRDTSLRGIIIEASFVVYATTRLGMLPVNDLQYFCKMTFSSSRFMHAGQTLYAATMPPLDQFGYVLMRTDLPRRMHGPEPIVTVASCPIPTKLFHSSSRPPSRTY
jgi:hypothetical protein